MAVLLLSEPRTVSWWNYFGQQCLSHFCTSDTFLALRFDPYYSHLCNSKATCSFIHLTKVSLVRVPRRGMRVYFVIFPISYSLPNPLFEINTSTWLTWEASGNICNADCSFEYCANNGRRNNEMFVMIGISWTVSRNQKTLKVRKHFLDPLAYIDISRLPSLSGEVSHSHSYRTQLI
jgi:hypothetical protein